MGEHWKIDLYQLILVIFTGVFALLGMIMTCVLIFKVNKYNMNYQLNDQKLNNISQKILSNHKQLNSLEQNFISFINELTDRFNNLEKLNNQTESLITKLNNQTGDKISNNMDNQSITLLNMIKESSNLIVQVNSLVNKLDNKIGEIKEEIKNVSQNLNNKSDIDKITNENLIKEINEIKNNLSKVDTDVNSLISKVNDNTNDIKNIQNSINELSTKITNNIDASSLQIENSELKTNISELQQQIIILKDKINEKVNYTEINEIKNNNTRLQNEVNSLKSQIITQIDGVDESLPLNVDFTKKFVFLCPICNTPIDESSIHFKHLDRSVNITYKCKYNSEHNGNMDLLNYFELIFPIQNNYEEKFICDKHNEYFVSYCPICQENLCSQCVYSKEEEEHKSSFIEYYQKEYNYDYMNEMETFRKTKEQVFSFIKNLNQKAASLLTYQKTLIEMKNNVFIYANNGTNYHRDTILQFLLSGYMLNFISDKNLTNNFTSIEKELLDSLITIKSNIVNNTDFEIILSFLPDNPKRVTRIYWGKEDGCNSTNFHNKCKDQGYTLSIVKSNLGYTFGGYTTKSWSGDGLIRDNESFVFSLDKKKNIKLVMKMQELLFYIITLLISFVQLLCMKIVLMIQIVIQIKIHIFLVMQFFKKVIIILLPLTLKFSK